MNGSPVRLTIAVALNGSPVGLLSWIVEKLRSSDGHGDVETRFSKGDLRTTVMIYWVTQSYGTPHATTTKLRTTPGSRSMSACP